MVCAIWIHIKYLNVPALVNGRVTPVKYHHPVWEVVVFVRRVAP